MVVGAAECFIVILLQCWKGRDYVKFENLCLQRKAKGLLDAIQTHSVA
jgi:hypothetical protein